MKETGIKPRSPTFQADSLSAEQQGKLKNTGVGSLSLLQQIVQKKKNLFLFPAIVNHGLACPQQQDREITNRKL